MSSQFSQDEIPHYPGALIGIRALEIYPDGSLRSPQRHFVWRDGENHANCPMKSSLFYQAQGKDPDSAVGELRCVCGFYGYFDAVDADGYMPIRDGFYAVIEAYGRLTYGSHGFRCAKAKIIAVAPRFPHTNSPDDFEPTAPVLNNTKSLTLFVGGLIWFFCIGIIGIILNNGWIISSMVLGLGAVVLGIWQQRREHDRYAKAMTNYRSLRSIWLRRQREAMWGVRPRSSPAWIEKAKERYPNVRWYNSMEEMVKAHPLSGADAITH